jgi:integrase
VKAQLRILTRSDVKLRAFASKNSNYCYVPKPAYTIKPCKHTRYKFVVRSKDSDGGWVRKFFESRGEAKTYADLKTIELMNQGREGLEFPSSLRVMAQQAHDQLSPYGKTIADAVAFFLPHVKAQATSRPVRIVVSELLLLKKKDGASDRYLKDLRTRLTIFANAHPEKSIAEFTAPAIDDWLRSLPHGAVTRNNYKRLLGVLFSYAVSRDYIPSNPAQKAEKAKVKPERPGILTVEQASRLLQSANEEILPAIAIGLFAGLRPEAEIWRLDWSAIDLKEKLIDVSKSKNLASDRFVNVAENLCAWLKPHAKKSGPVSPTGDKYHSLMHAARAAVTAAAIKDGKPEEGVQAWPPDCLRHTFASMHYGHCKNAGETAQQLGHGQNLRTFIRHYKNRVKPVDANRFWKLMPSAPLTTAYSKKRAPAKDPSP